MIVVSGTKRSGTSMWMQILARAGVPIVGDPFPRTWGATIRDANPRGFYESGLRKGLYWATNPDPTTGVFLRPDDLAGRAVKIFAPGLVRSDFGYIEQAVISMRRCREYVASLGRLYALEAEGIEALRGARRRPRVRMTPELEWWTDNWLLIRDVATRRYPAQFVSYDAVLRDAGTIVPSMCAWVGAPHPESGIEALAGELRTQHDAPPVGIPEEGVFDELYARVDAGEALDEPFLRGLSELHARLLPRIRAERAAVAADVRRRRANRPRAGIAEGLLRFDDDWAEDPDSDPSDPEIDLR